MVFGKIAGKEAAEFAINSNFIKIDKEQFGKGQEMIHGLFGKNNKVEIPPSPIKREVKVTLSRFCGPLKSEESLLFALDKLRNLEKKIPYVYANDFKGLQDALESRFMILLSELVAWSALTRQESRGSHCRLDFPETDDKYWLKNIVIKKRDGEPEPFIEKKLSKTFIAQKSSMKLKLKERKVLIKRRVHS
jgi:succinate dehydrogenase/fumarate reductase flavoprotein subunit